MNRPAFAARLVDLEQADQRRVFRKTPGAGLGPQRPQPSTFLGIVVGAGQAEQDPRERFIVFDLGDPRSPIVTTWSGMSPADVADLLAGNLYINIHASGRPEGEIRGQILPRTVDAFSFFPTGDQEVPPTDSNAVGNCFADLAANPTSLLVRCSHNVDNVISTHLHSAPPGVEGPVAHRHVGALLHRETDEADARIAFLVGFAAGDGTGDAFLTVKAEPGGEDDVAVLVAGQRRPQSFLNRFRTRRRPDDR